MIAPPRSPSHTPAKPLSAAAAAPSKARAQPFKHHLFAALEAPQLKKRVPQEKPAHAPVAMAKEKEKERAPKERPDKHAAPVDPLDPSVRAAAALAPPVAPSQPSTASEEVTTRARVSLEELLPLVVRRIAWGGDKTKAAVHVELAAGAFAGSTVTVHAAEGARRVRLEVGGAGDHDQLRERLAARLRRAGIEVDE